MAPALPGSTVSTWMTAAWVFSWLSCQLRPCLVNVHCEACPPASFTSDWVVFTSHLLAGERRAWAAVPPEGTPPVVPPLPWDSPVSCLCRLRLPRGSQATLDPEGAVQRWRMVGVCGRDRSLVVPWGVLGMCPHVVRGQPRGSVPVWTLGRPWPRGAVQPGHAPAPSSWPCLPGPPTPALITAQPFSLQWGHQSGSCGTLAQVQASSVDGHVGRWP